MEKTPKVNVKRFWQSKIETNETPIIGKKSKKKVVFEEPILEQPIIKKPIIEEPIVEEPILEKQLPENCEVDDNFLSELNTINYQKEKEE